MRHKSADKVKKIFLKSFFCHPEHKKKVQLLKTGKNRLLDGPFTSYVFPY